MERMKIGEVSLEVLTAGDGPPLLFLHGGDYFAQHRDFFERLARRWRLMVPRHPGFGRSERPDNFRTIHDLAYLYLELLERQDLRDVVLVGSSFGGWIALEMCVRCLERVGRLVLIDPVGVKFGGREERDIADIYALPSAELLRRTFFDPPRAAPNYAGLDDEEAQSIARDVFRPLARFLWKRAFEPDMKHVNPLLRITVRPDNFWIHETHIDYILAVAQKA